MGHKRLLGKIVKIIFEPTDKDPRLAIPERMWVIVDEDLGNGIYKGTLDNDPATLKSIKADDIVMFNQDQVVDVFDNDNKRKAGEIDKYEIPFEIRKYLPGKAYTHIFSPQYDSLLKITVDVDENWSELVLKEELLVKQIGIRTYQIKCIPFCVEKLCYNDVITFFPNSFFEYGMFKSDYLTIDIYNKDDDFTFLNKYTDIIVETTSLKNRTTIAFKVKDYIKLEPLFEEISNKDLYCFSCVGYDRLIEYINIVK